MSSKIGIKDISSESKMIWFYRRHICLAVLDILGIELAPHQRIFVKSLWNHSYIVGLMSRGMGKTFLMAIIQIMFCALYKGLRIVSLGSAAFRQSKFIAREAERIIKGEAPSQRPYEYILDCVSDRKKPILRQNDEWRCEIGSSAVYYVPPTTAIRGYRANILFTDEANDLSDEIDQKVIRPFANVKRNFNSSNGEDNKIVYCGTLSYKFLPYYKKIQAYRTNRLRDGLQKYIVVEFNYEDAIRRTKDWLYQYYPISLENIESGMDSAITSKESWLAENKNVAIDGSGGFYPLSLLQSAMNYKKKYAFKREDDSGKKYYIGIDPARNNDSFAITVAEEVDNGELSIVKLYNYTKESYIQLAKKIDELCNTDFQNCSIWIDMGAGGAGKVLCDILKDSTYMSKPLYNPDDEENAYILNSPGNSRPIVHYIQPTNENNGVWNSTFKGMLENKRFILPALYENISKWDEEDFEEAGLSSYDRDFHIQQHKTYAELLRQLTNIELRQNAQTVSFVARSGKKDLYSSCLYSVAGYYITRSKENNATPAQQLAFGFWHGI